MSTPDNNDFHLDLTYTGRDYTAFYRRIGIAAASLIILVILATMTTGLAARLLPMSDSYLQVLVPVAKDGKEPLALKTLENSTLNNTLTVNGTVENRTDFPLAGLVAVLEATHKAYAKEKIEVHLDPAEIPASGTASFTASVTLPAQPAQFSLTFRIVDGPVVAHLDDRAASYGLGNITPTPGPIIKTK